MNQRQRLLAEFSTLNCIQNESILEQYVDFCIDNSLLTKHQSSTHHILPKAKTLPFAKFANLQTFFWNASELTYYNHYIAHFLLTKAVRHIAVSHAFIGMHHKDANIERLTQDQLISAEEYAKLYKEWNKLISERRLEIIVTEDGPMTRASFARSKWGMSDEARRQSSDRIKGVRNMVYRDGIVDKIRQTKLKTNIDGKSLDAIGAERAAATMRTEFINEIGETTTRYRETGRKLSVRLNTTIEVDGQLKTIAQHKGDNKSYNDKYNGKWYVLRNVFDPSVDIAMPLYDLRALSGNLDRKTKTDYLGQSTWGKNFLTTRGKPTLVGAYSEICEPSAEYRTQHLNRTQGRRTAV